VTDLRSRRTVWQHTNASEPAFSHRGALLAFEVGLSPTNSALTLFDIPTQKETRLATVPTTNWNWIGFTPDDRLLVGVTEIPGSKSGDPQLYNVTAWDVATGTQLWQRGIPHTPSGCDFRTATRLPRDLRGLSMCWK
jgi:hypothetical protein